MAKFSSPMQINPGDIRTDTSTQEASLGAIAYTPDGRAFRYCKVGGTALVPGSLYDGPAFVANHSNLAVAVAAAAGATQVTVTLGGTAATANQYAGGLLVIQDADGEGYTFTIKSHPAQTSTTGDLTVTLEDDEPIVTALTTSSEATLVLNQYNGVIVHATTETGVPVGVAVTAVTASQFGWLQTHGPVGLLMRDTNGIGQSVAASDTTGAGGAEVGDGVLPVIGYQMQTGVAGETNPVFLTID